MIYHHFLKIECANEHRKSVQRKELIRQTYSIDLSQDKEIMTEHKEKIKSLDFDHSDMKYLLSGSAGSNICIHDLSTSILPGNMLFHPLVQLNQRNVKNFPEDGFYCVRWYPEDTGLFITSSGDKRICVWDTNESTILLSKQFYRHVCTLDMSKRESERYLIAYGSPTDPLVHFMDIRSGYISQILKGHENGINSVRWHPTKDHMIISASNDGTIRLWDIRTSSHLFVFNKHYVTTSSIRKKKTSMPISHSKGVLNVEFTPDGRYILSTGKDNEMRLWDSEFGYHMFVSYDSMQSYGSKDVPQLCISNQGDIVYRSCHKVIEAYDIQTGRLVNVLRGHYDTVTSSVFHPSLPQLYTGGMDKKILIWTPMNEMNEDMDDEEEDEKY